MSHPSNNNRVMANEEVVDEGVIVEDEVVTSRARETRPNPSNNLSPRLAPLNLLLPRLPLLTHSSSVTSHPPLSLSLLCHHHHSTRASTRLYLLRGGLVLHQPHRLSNALRELSVPLTLAPSRSVLPPRRTKSHWIGLEMRMT